MLSYFIFLVIYFFFYEGNLLGCHFMGENECMYLGLQKGSERASLEICPVGIGRIAIKVDVVSIEMMSNISDVTSHGVRDTLDDCCRYT